MPKMKHKQPKEAAAAEVKSFSFKNIDGWSCEGDKDAERGTPGNKPF